MLELQSKGQCWRTRIVHVADGARLSRKAKRTALYRREGEADADGRIPAVVHRRNREPWLITMRLDDWIVKEGRT